MTTDGPADLVLLGGRIATMDSARSWASGLAVRDGRIAAIGTDHAVRPHVGAARSHRCTGGVHVRIGVREPSGRHRLARVGKLADLAILDRDLFDRAEGAIGEARVVGTFVEGGAVYETADLGG